MPDDPSPPARSASQPRWPSLAAGSQAIQPHVTVNLSARQFHDPGLLSMVEEALTESGLAPKRLVLEITESAALVDVVETKLVIERLGHYGVTVALDDFGTGYSSLSYLALLHPMIIKIDRSFVSPSKASIYNDTLLEAIVSLGHKLNMTVHAEGIETQAQLGRLRHLPCEVGQGYLFSPTVPAGEVAAMLGRVPGDWGHKLALSPPADPPPVRSGANTPRSSDAAYWDRLNSRSGSPVPLRRYGSVEDVGGSLEAALESRQIPLDGPDRARPVVIGHDGTR